jgi:hypothetical protein
MIQNKSNAPLSIASFFSYNVSGCDGGGVYLMARQDKLDVCYKRSTKNLWHNDMIWIWVGLLSYRFLPQSKRMRLLLIISIYTINLSKMAVSKRAGPMMTSLWFLTHSFVSGSWHFFITVKIILDVNNRRQFDWF